MVIGPVQYGGIWSAGARSRFGAGRLLPRSGRGMKLSQVDGRPDTLGEPSGGLAAVITSDISLELEPPNPKRYLILRDIGADAAAFYSDTPHPPRR